MDLSNTPIAQCMQRTIRVPPVRLGTNSDFAVLQLLRHLGRRSGVSEPEIRQACDLASGPNDILILLERPHQSQDYEQPFEVFVNTCPTLKGLDDLIRLATRGSRSIYTVSVLDAFSLKPTNDGKRPSDADCHTFIEQAIYLKRPRVILCCWQGDQVPTSIDQYRSKGMGFWPMKEEIVIENTRITLFRSFHPAKVIRYARFNGTYQGLLIYHYILAFAHLTDDVAYCPCVKRTSKQDKSDSKSVRPHYCVFLLKIKCRYSDVVASSHETQRLIGTLTRLKGTLSRKHYNMTLQKDREDAELTLDGLLGSVESISSNVGTAEIMGTLSLWRILFSSDARQEVVAARLLGIGNRQICLSASIASTHIGFAESDEEVRGVTTNLKGTSLT